MWLFSCITLDFHAQRVQQIDHTGFMMKVGARLEIHEPVQMILNLNDSLSVSDHEAHHQCDPVPRGLQALALSSESTDR